MRLYDAHNHLHDERFGGRQEELIPQARAAGVVAMVVNGSSEEDWPAVAELARQFAEFIIPSFGLHPWYVHERSPQWKDRLNRLLDDMPGAVVGEIGLDRWILDCPPAARAAIAPELATVTAAPLAEQEEVFAEQLEIAAARNLPASIHCLQAWGPLHQRIREGPRPARGFLLHSYGGSAELAGALCSLGAYFSFPGYFLHARKARQRETFRMIPGDRLLAETDAPDQRLPSTLPDRPAGSESIEVFELADAQGRPINHPANLRAVYVGLADLLDRTPEGLASELETNFKRLFGR